MNLKQITNLKRKIDEAKTQRSIIEGKISVHLKKLNELGFKNEIDARKTVKKIEIKVKKGERRYLKLLNKFLKKYKVEGEYE